MAKIGIPDSNRDRPMHEQKRQKFVFPQNDAKTISGSRFHFTFVCLVLELVENAVSIDRVWKQLLRPSESQSKNFKIF